MTKIQDLDPDPLPTQIEDYRPAAITKEAIAKERAERLQACGRAIAEVLEQYDCKIVATPQISEGRIVAPVEIADRS